MDKQILNLILQMATEINRMETNMLRMDSATKGYSQLQRSINVYGKLWVRNSGNDRQTI